MSIHSRDIYCEIHSLKLFDFFTNDFYGDFTHEQNISFNISVASLWNLNVSSMQNIHKQIEDCYTIYFVSKNIVPPWLTSFSFRTFSKLICQ